MFYRIRNNKLYDYADYKYAPKCLETDIVTQAELDQYPNKVVVVDDELVLNPDFDIEELTKAKQLKYQEANLKAKEFLEGGEATFELTPGFHVEASKENMNTFTSAAIAIEKGLIEYQQWTSKEDNQLNLDEEQCMTISMGIGVIQGDVWNRQFIAYKTAIEEAQTVEEVNEIEIDYETESEGE